MKVWGISGGIATGKSAACKLLSSDSGIAVIDCDVIARTVVEKVSPSDGEPFQMATGGTTKLLSLCQLVLLDLP